MENIITGASLQEAGLIGNLVASICISQLGSTGHVTAEQIIQKFDSLLEEWS